MTFETDQLPEPGKDGMDTSFLSPHPMEESQVGAEHIGGSYIRLFLAAVWMLWAFSSASGSEWLPPLLFVGYAAVAHVLVVQGVIPLFRVYTLMVIDTVVILAFSYHDGTLVSAFPVFLLAHVAGHTWDRHRGTGPICLVVAFTGYVALIALEAWSVLPPQVGGPGTLDGNTPFLSSMAATWPFLFALVGIHFIMGGSVKRTQAYIAQLRALMATERASRTRAADLQRRLVQAQRLESVGRLAGGVAHDFNNILTTILGFTHLAREDLEEGDPRREDLDEVMRSAHRAGELTRQLLAVGRKQVVHLQPTDLNEVLGGLERMLTSTLGEAVTFRLDLDSEIGIVVADPSQLEQVVVNLVVNARDAMPIRGSLTVSTHRMSIGAKEAQNLGGIEPGSYVRLSVVDTGIGMDSETLAQAFDPFFTTKGLGEGTGLGLATVYGIVQQNRGAVTVMSAPGQGTSFHTYWPSGTGEVTAEEATPPVLVTRSGTVLLVEDEETVRILAARILRQAGYLVYEATDGHEALARLDTFPAPPDILLTDVVMPKMSGGELAKHLQTRFPGIGVLFMSGHPDHVVDQHGALPDDTALVGKPFRANELVKRVREMIEGRAAA